MKDFRSRRNRLGIRMEGPKPQWARSDGGEGGSHPSNVHDHVYAIGSINFTGDMPIALMPDGPSLGGFVCPATIISAEMWKMGQVRMPTSTLILTVTLQSFRVHPSSLRTVRISSNHSEHKVPMPKGHRCTCYHKKPLSSTLRDMALTMA